MRGLFRRLCLTFCCVTCSCVAPGCSGDADDDSAAPHLADDDDDTTPSPFGNDAAFVAQVVPTSVAAGASLDFEITMENVGTTTWTAAEDYLMGSQNPQDNQTWSIGRLYLEAADAVAPGSSATFVGAATAPATLGTHDFQWRMLREHVEWFGEYTPNLAIEVEEGSDECANGVLDSGETDVDCGGPCAACEVIRLSPGEHHYPMVAATDEIVMVTFSDAEEGDDFRWMCKDESGWTASQQMAGLGSPSEFTRMAVDSQGRIHLAVHEGGGSGRGIYYSRFDPGSGCSGTWTSPTRLDDGSHNSCWPAIAVDEDDNPHVFWTEDYYEMHYSVYVGGSWNGPRVVIDSVEQSCHGDITVAGSVPHVLWQEGDGPRLPTWSHGTGADFSAPEALTNTFNNWPQIKADGHGRLHVLYTYRYGDYDVKYVRQDGGTWSGETVVSSGPTAWAWSILDIDDAGGLHATWSQTENVEHVYYAIGDGSTGTWDSPRKVSTDDTEHNYMSALAVDPSNRAHIVWIQIDDIWTVEEEPGPLFYRVVTWEDLGP